MLLISNLIITLILFLTIINCETIHFTNSPNYFVNRKNYTTYKLDVPGGTNSITIIEAANTPNKNLNQENYKSDSLLETESSLNKKTVYAPSLLEKFMNEYNIKVSTNLQSELRHHRPTTTDSNHVIKRNYDDYLETDDNNNYHNNDKKTYFDNRSQTMLSSLSTLKKNGGDNVNINPFNEKEGWVTLQAIPWSKSKVSKWKPKADIKPVGGNGYNLYQNNDQESTYNGLNNDQQHNIDISQSNYENLRPNFYDNNDEYITNNKNDNRRSTSKPLSVSSVPWNTNNNNDYYNSKPIETQPNEKPQIEVAPNYDRWYDYGFRPDLEDRFDKRPSLPKPTMHHQQQNHYLNDNHRYTNNNNNNNENLEDNIQNSAIYINGGNGYSSNRNAHRYPKPSSFADRITSSSESQYSSNNFNNHHHPITHPSNGKGEWVLVSTTKGYQHPPSPTRSVPRGSKFINPNSNTNTVSSSTMTNAQSVLSQQPNNYRTHKSIKLTVLPAETEDGKLKPMKLSHGGLLEVEDSAAQSVEDSAAEASATKIKKKKLVKRKAVPMQFVPITAAQKIDKTAVLAAVGAGMVPASMAMLMPLVLGRRKRSLLNKKEVDINEKIFNYENILNKIKKL